mmetsp:Transcript_56546/g.89805  ORF Transcript_56546/g.89805 Transcript_56546/m.89805 type:complete len:121 (+) Transcript_56546:24-386(+)
MPTITHELLIYNYFFDNRYKYLRIKYIMTASKPFTATTRPNNIYVAALGGAKSGADGPSGPSSPGGPRSPTSPTGPSGPSSPTAPASPIGPTSPRGPGAPGGPVSHFLSMPRSVQSAAQQ